MLELEVKRLKAQYGVDEAKPNPAASAQNPLGKMMMALQKGQRVLEKIIADPSVLGTST
jgi:hypothetical protein